MFETRIYKQMKDAVPITSNAKKSALAYLVCRRRLEYEFRECTALLSKR